MTPGSSSSSPPLRVLYVEDDPVLRSLLTGLLEDAPGLEVVAGAGSADEALEALGDTDPDVALVDLALGPRSLNGIDLGLRLRALKPHLGIVIISQHLVTRFLSSVHETERHGWSYIQKRGDLTATELAQVISATAAGRTVIDPSALDGQSLPRVPLAKLTPRQRSIVALLATGRDAIGIADELNLAHSTVRRDISNAYKVLVPKSGPGDDLRVTAVLEYLRATRPYDFEG